MFTAGVVVVARSCSLVTAAADPMALVVMASVVELLEVVAILEGVSMVRMVAVVGGVWSLTDGVVLMVVSRELVVVTGGWILMDAKLQISSVSWRV
jgi:hypothetical protein